MPRAITRSGGLTVLLIWLLPSPGASAWSNPGHQAICQIAFLELTAGARRQVNKILSPETPRFKPFARACTWADDRKHEDGTIQNVRRDEHFVNVSRSLPAITSEDCGTTPRCLFTAIRADEDALKNGTGGAQLTALKFLGHWIGDLHQPLHISYADDRGGNDIPVSQAVGCGQLHAVWDYCIPEALRRQMGANNGPTDLGTKLDAEITDAERAQWRQGTLLDWAEESYAVTRKAETKYCLMKGDSCCYNRRSCENRAGRSTNEQTKRLMRLPHSYVDAEVATVKEQLKKAGVRLAAVLEAQFR
jgi:hypothetical protein